MSGSAFGPGVMPPEPETSIEIESGVSAMTGEPFLSVHVNGVRRGQMTPEEVRGLALQWLGAADAAESDAAVFAELTETVGMPAATAGAFVAALRARRSP